MAEKCNCGLNMKDLAMFEEPMDLGLRKVACVKCGIEFLTDIPGKTKCFKCEKQ